VAENDSMYVVITAAQSSNVLLLYIVASSVHTATQPTKMDVHFADASILVQYVIVLYLKGNSTLKQMLA